MTKLTFKNIQGYGTSRGIATGKATFIHNTHDVKQFQDKHILIAKNTDTAYLPAMMRAAAIVTEEGGLLSHASLTARELNIPCVVGIPDIFNRIRQGQTITVDGDKGIITFNANPTTLTTAKPYDTALLYCFDRVKEINIGNKKCLIEKSKEEITIHPELNDPNPYMLQEPIEKKYHFPARVIVSPKYAIWKSFTRQMTHNPIFKHHFELLLKSVNALDSKKIDQQLHQLYDYAKIIRKKADVAPTNSIDKYIYLDTLNGCFMQSNSFIPEGYGIRAVYEAILPHLEEEKITFSQFITQKKTLPKFKKIKSCYKVLAKWREQSMPLYERIQGAGDAFNAEWSALKTHLKNELSKEGKAFDKAIYDYGKKNGIWKELMRIMGK